jgi:hypothetical protein
MDTIKETTPIKENNGENETYNNHDDIKYKTILKEYIIKEYKNIIKNEI